MKAHRFSRSFDTPCKESSTGLGTFPRFEQEVTRQRQDVYRRCNTHVRLDGCRHCARLHGYDQLVVEIDFFPCMHQAPSMERGNMTVTSLHVMFHVADDIAAHLRAHWLWMTPHRIDSRMLLIFGTTGM